MFKLPPHKGRFVWRRVREYSQVFESSLEEYLRFNIFGSAKLILPPGFNNSLMRRIADSISQMMKHRRTDDRVKSPFNVGLLESPLTKHGWQANGERVLFGVIPGRCLPQQFWHRSRRTFR